MDENTFARMSAMIAQPLLRKCIYNLNTTLWGH
jgi:hypothetical protein